MRLIYVAETGELKAGHTDNTEYTIGIDVQAIDRRFKEYNKTQHTIDRSRYTDHHATERMWSVTTRILEDGAAIDQFDMWEFIWAVRGEQIFTFDPDGITSSVTPTSCILLTSDHKRVRVSQLPAFRFSFNFLEV